MPTDENKNEDFKQRDPDLNEGDATQLENFDEPFPRRQILPRPTAGPAGRTTLNLETGLGSFFKGLNEVANFITELAEKTEQAAQNAAERRQQNANNGTDNADKGFAARWGLNTSILQNRGGATPFTNRPPFAGRAPATTTRPTPSGPIIYPPASENEGSLREPYIEIHEEAEENLIVVIAELPGVEEQNLQIEIQDDILIIRGEATGFAYEKEVLLPAMVLPEPQSRTYQNGLLELRLKMK